MTRSYSLLLNNLGNVCLKLKNFGESKQYFLKAIKINKILIGKNDPVYLSTLLDIGILYQVTGKHIRAENIFKGIDIREKNNNLSDSLNHVATLINLGSVQRTLGKYTSAEKFLLESIRIRNKILKKLCQEKVKT